MYKNSLKTVFLQIKMPEKTAFMREKSRSGATVTVKMIENLNPERTG